MKTLPRLASTALVVLLSVASSCGGEAASAAATQQPVATPQRVATQPPAAPFQEATLAAFQCDLLELAFGAASAFPQDPHRKNRSRAQDQVVVACFELGQPKLALAYGSRITDWRRGCAYADYAWSCARSGETDEALEYVALARRVVDDSKGDPTAQEWRSDLISLKLARALTALGDHEAAAKAAAGIDVVSTHAVDADWAKTAVERVRALTPATAVSELAAMDAALPTMSLGQQNVMLATVARLHEVFFAETAVRTGCEQRLVTDWNRLPPGLRLDALAQLVATCLAQQDPPGALRLVGAMRVLVEGHTWRSEDRMPQVARLIELAFRAGQPDRARAEAEAALAAYHTERERIVDIYRAETLRPLALAWFTIGDPQKGLDLLALALEEGMENPNSRPRCDDLVDTCIDLCKRAIEPSPALWARLREIRGGLGDPW